MRISAGFLVVFVALYTIGIAEAGKDKKEKHRDKPSREGSSEESNFQGHRPYCYDDDDDPYIYFATKTAYRWNRNKNDDEIKHDGCEPKQFWLLSRHGTRNPGTEDMIELETKLPILRTQIIENHRNGRGKLCNDDIKNLVEWRFRANVTDDKFLVKEGYDELEDLGDRFQERFETLLTKPFVNESYVLRFTDSERTDSSAEAFARGMFGKKDLKNVYFQRPINPDPLLRFYKTCKRWKVEVDDNPEAIKEKTLYESTDDVLSVIKAVSERLGFTSQLTLDDIDLMFNMCSFDKAWRPKKLSPWCAAFSREDLEILEYREDLEYFYEDGYGHSINYVQACPIVKDVVDHFTQVVESAPYQPKGLFYFTHSGTLLKVLARLGLFEDPLPLKHSNRKEMEVRQWRTSLIDSFASNLAFVLYTCRDGHRVATYVQERTVQLPGCGSPLCPFSEFTARYGPYAASCNLEEICRV